MRLVQKKHVIWKLIEHEVIFLDSWNGNYFSLNGTGARMWELLSSGNTLEEVAASIHAEYDIGLEDARADLSELAKSLEEWKLAEEVA